MVEKLNNDASAIEGLVKALNVSLNTGGVLLRDDESVPSEIMEHVFSLSLTNSYPMFDGVELDNGQFAVVRLNDVVKVAESEAKVETAEWITVQGEYGRREMQAMLKALRETGDVSVFPENL